MDSCLCEHRPVITVVWWNTRLAFTLISGIGPLNLFYLSVPPTPLMIRDILSPFILDHHVCVLLMDVFSPQVSLSLGWMTLSPYNTIPTKIFLPHDL